MAQDYYTILTNAGLAYEAACKANQVPIKLTHFAVGDGNGAAYNPGPDATALRRETHRQSINSLLQDEDNPSWLMAEALIADNVGGWTIREVGIYTDTGILYAIGKYPDSIKPILAQGSGKQFYVRTIFQTSNASSVTLLVDNSVVMATRAFVLDQLQIELAKRDAKNSVKAATTAALAALSGLQTVDGVSLVAGDRVLVKNQAAGATNGIYVVAAGAWARAADADASIEVTPGLLVTVEQGTTNGDSLWQLVTDAPITLGTTALIFEIAAGPSGVAAGTYSSVTVDKRGRVTGGSNPVQPINLGGTGATTQAQALANLGAAPLNSAALTGTPTAPTPTAGTNNTQISTTAFVQAAIAALVNSSPAALDTLKELATALGNDPNFATTMTNALAGKADRATTLSGYGVTADATALVRSIMEQFGLGTATAGAQITTTLSAARETGLYHCSGSVSDAPVAGDGAVIEAIGSGNRRVQIYITLAGQSFFFRTQPIAAGAFGDWRTVWDSSSMPKASQTEAEAGALDSRLMTPLRVAQAIAARVIQATEAVIGIAKIATQAMVNAGTDDTTIVTPKKLRWGVSYLIAANGYVAFPSWLGGWIVQWGTVTITTTTPGGTTTATLPFSYPNNHFGALGNYKKNAVISDSFPVNTYPTSLSTVTLSLDAATGGSTPTGAQEAFYLSIGN